MKYVLRGQPLSTNHIYKMTCRWKFAQMYMTAEWKKLKELYQLQARVQHSWPIISNEDIKAEVIIYFWDKRKRDLDNHNKIWQDALSWIAYKDDKQIADLHIKRRYDKANPRIEVDIEPLYIY